MRTTMNVGTQAPAASQRLPPGVPQLPPAGRLGFDGAPAEHRSPVHGSPSTGTSVSSTCDVVAPAPSQTVAWQSPGAVSVILVPAGSATGAQAPATQRAFLQAVSPELSQSESARH